MRVFYIFVALLYILLETVVVEIVVTAMFTMYYERDEPTFLWFSVIAFCALAMHYRQI